MILPERYLGFRRWRLILLFFLFLLLTNFLFCLLHFIIFNCVDFFLFMLFKRWFNTLFFWSWTCFLFLNFLRFFWNRKFLLFLFFFLNISAHYTHFYGSLRFSVRMDSYRILIDGRGNDWILTLIRLSSFLNSLHNLCQVNFI